MNNKITITPETILQPQGDIIPSIIRVTFTPTVHLQYKMQFGNDNFI